MSNRRLAEAGRVRAPARRPRVVAFVVAVVALVAAPAARAANPCADDIKRLCAQVRPGRGRVRQCLRQSQANLSPACSEKVDADDQKVRALIEKLVVSCRRDVGRFCAHVKPAGGRVLACLDRHQDDLSGACSTEMERIEAARETVLSVREACRADVERVCGGASAEAGALVECLELHEGALSAECRSVDPGLASAAAELVDAVEEMTSQKRVLEALEILQGLDSVAFSRSQMLFQVDSYQGLAGRGNANRLLFNPQFVFGRRNDLSFQLKIPVTAFYPYASGASAQTGLGNITAALAWAFSTRGQVRQYLSLGLQLSTAPEPAFGAAWAVTPAYAIAVGLARWVSLTSQVAWFRSFARGDFPEVDLLVLEPILAVNLPGRGFAALDTKLGWNLVDDSFVPVMKGVVGLFIDRQRSLSISTWYQAALTTAAQAQTFKFGVGAGLAYFFDW